MFSSVVDDCDLTDIAEVGIQASPALPSDKRVPVARRTYSSYSL
jgi:hypothetical protein